MWTPTAGTYKIRILPVSDGDLFKEYHFHYNVYEPRILCPRRTYGAACPICRFASELWLVAKENGNDVQRSEARRLFVRKRYFTLVVLLRANGPELKIWSFESDVFQDLLEIVLDLRFGDISHPKTGRDLWITYTSTNTKPTITLASEESMLDSSAVRLLSFLPNIEDLLEHKTADEVQQHLDSYLSHREALKLQS